MANLIEIRDVLIDAVLAGGREVLAIRAGGDTGESYKDSTELVTRADRNSDAAMLRVFRERLDSTITFHLEESGVIGKPGAKIVGADPLDGTNHFAAGGNWYAVMAHYVVDGIPQIGVVLQPEVFIPLSEEPVCLGRLVWAIRGGGAFFQRSAFRNGNFELGETRQVSKRPARSPRGFVACVPISSKMNESERERASRVHQSGLVAASTGAGNAGGNVMLCLFGGQDVYANFGAGEDLDLIPPQVIALEAGWTVWGSERKEPVWNVRKQPFIVAPNAEIAEQFFQPAGPR